jgi:hypothetical protein
MPVAEVAADMVVVAAAVAMLAAAVVVAAFMVVASVVAASAADFVAALFAAAIGDMEATGATASDTRITDMGMRAAGAGSQYRTGIAFTFAIEGFRTTKTRHLRRVFFLLSAVERSVFGRRHGKPPRRSSPTHLTAPSNARRGIRGPSMMGDIFIVAGSLDLSGTLRP